MARAFPDRLADRTDWFLSAAASRRYAARRAHYGKSEAAGAFAAQADCRRDDAGDRRHFVDVHHRVFSAFVPDVDAWDAVRCIGARRMYGGYRAAGRLAVRGTA